MHRRGDIYDENSGRIEIVLGPMFSGKSTELIRQVNRHKISKKICCVIKHSLSK
jgi:thymidine kinase